MTITLTRPLTLFRFTTDRRGRRIAGELVYAPGTPLEALPEPSDLPGGVWAKVPHDNSAVELGAGEWE